MTERPRLPKSGNAYVEEKKITQYLLNAQHEEGKSKAKFFVNRGFNVDYWNQFHDALVSQGISNDVVKTTETPYGTLYVVECNCPTPDRSNPCIRTVWELRQESEQPRLITAHPM